MNTFRLNGVMRGVVLALALALLLALVFAGTSFATGGGQARWATLDHGVSTDDVARADDHYVASFATGGSVSPSCFGGSQSYTPGDALFFEPHGVGPCWIPWFDATNSGLNAGANINGLHDECGPNDPWCDIYLSFQGVTNVPGVGSAKPQDVVMSSWDGLSLDTYINWQMVFDGSDVGLRETSEKIDGLYIFDPGEEPDDLYCSRLLLISTAGTYRVPDYWGNNIDGGGEDVLGFCASWLGWDTAGYWFLYHDGSAEGAPANSIIGLTHEDGGKAFSRFEFLTKGEFEVDLADGDNSEVFNFFGQTGLYNGPTFSFPDDAWTTDKVDSFTVYHTE